MNVKKILVSLITVTFVLGAVTFSTAAKELTAHSQTDNKLAIVNGAYILSLFTESSKDILAPLLVDAKSVTISQQAQISQKNALSSSTIPEGTTLIQINIEYNDVNSIQSGSEYEKESTIIIAATEWDASKDVSDGIYDIACSFKLTWKYQQISGLEGKIKLKQVDGKIYDAGTNPLTVKKLTFGGVVYNPSTLYKEINQFTTINNPSSGTQYSKSISSGFYDASWKCGLEYALVLSNDSGSTGSWYIQASY